MMTTELDTRPTELTIEASRLTEVCAEIEQRGGRVQSWEVVPKRNGLWRLNLVWPACTCEICQPDLALDAPERTEAR